MNDPEIGDGIFLSLAEATAAAQQLQAAGRSTKVEESMFHPGWFILYAERIVTTA